MARAKYFRFHDGGRAAAGYCGKTGDCVVRSIAIATGLPYQHIYDLVNRASTRERTGTRKRGISNARTGVYKSTIHRVMKELGWAWTPTMQIGSGCTVHLRPNELPSGRLVVSVSKHLTAMIDGIIHDTHDCSRRGKRCVYGYWQPPPRRSLNPTQTEFFVQPRTQPRSQEQRRADWERSIDREIPLVPPCRPAPRKPARPQQPPDPPRRKSFFEWLFGKFNAVSSPVAKIRCKIRARKFRYVTNRIEGPMFSPSRARRIAIVGSGMVGSTTAYALLLEGISAEIVLIDKNQSLAEGHADDLSDAQLYSRAARVFAGDFSDCATADVIIITAGVNQALMGNSRVNDITAASEIVKGIVDEIRRYDPCGIILVASNPLDVMTYAVGKWSGLPPNRVIGSGTSLDTSRFRRRLAQHFGIAPENVHAFIIGEHGDTQVPVLSSARIAGMSLEDFCRDRGLPYDESLFLAIANKTRTAGYAIQQAKGSTYYGIATALTRIVRAIWKDENTVLTVSRLVPPELGLGDVCLSLPVTLGLEGASRPLNLTLSPAERAALHHSADTLKQYIARIESLAPQTA